MQRDVVHAALVCLQGVAACWTALGTSLLALQQPGPACGDSHDALAAPRSAGVGAEAAAAAAAAAEADTPGSTSRKKRSRPLDAAQRQSAAQQRQQHKRAQRQGSGQQPAAGSMEEEEGEEEADAAAGQPAEPGSPQQQGAAPPDVYKYWGEDEAESLVKCVEDANSRRQHVGVEQLSWHAIADHFNRSVQAIRCKYRNERLIAQGLMKRNGELRSRQQQSITYGYMAIYALSTLPDQMGTGDEVLAAVDAHPPFQQVLDRNIRPDSTGVARWQQRIREELSHRAYFHNTGIKRNGQTVWRLDPSCFTEKECRKLKDRLPGLPFLGRHGQVN